MPKMSSKKKVNCIQWKKRGQKNRKSQIVWNSRCDETHHGIASVAVIALHSIKHIAPHQSNTGESFIFFFSTWCFNQTFRYISLPFTCPAAQRKIIRRQKVKKKKIVGKHFSLFSLFRQETFNKNQIVWWNESSK